MNKYEKKSERMNPFFKITAIILAAFFLFFGFRAYADISAVEMSTKVPDANDKLYKK